MNKKQKIELILRFLYKGKLSQKEASQLIMYLLEEKRVFSRYGYTNTYMCRRQFQSELGNNLFGVGNIITEKEYKDFFGYERKKFVPWVLTQEDSLGNNLEYTEG